MNNKSKRMECCKLGRVAHKYGLQKYLTEELGSEWESQNGASLRDLAQKFNYRVLRIMIADVGETPLEGEVENIYDSLQSDDSTGAAEKRVEQRLADYGLEEDEVKSDFVSYRTIDRHFKNCEDRTRVKSQVSTNAAVESAMGRVRALEKRLQLVSEKTLEDLAKMDRISLEDFDVTVNSRVTCNECGNQFPISEALESGCRICNNDK